MTEIYCIKCTKFGRAENLRKEALCLLPIDAHEIRIKHTSIGLNFIDTYHRTGLYPIPIPSILGLEAVGYVEEVGKDVTDFTTGDLVGYCTAGLGAYATHRHVAVENVFTIPNLLPADKAAACLLKGLTSEYLLRKTYRVQAGDTVLFHAIAGGVGLIACQWLKQLGATVIGTVSTEEKAHIAKQHGCDHVIRYDHEDVVKKVHEITEGEGVPVVYDGVGKDTFESSLNCLKPRGMMVSFGNASGAVDPCPPALLASKGSLFLTRPSLGHYTATPEELKASANAFFTAVEKGVKITCNTQFSLQNAADAHRQLESRKILGQAVLIP